MPLQSFPILEFSGRLHHDIDFMGGPINLLGRAEIHQAYLLAIYDNVLLVMFYLPLKYPMDAIILEQVRQGPGIREVVYGNDIKVRVFGQQSEQGTAYPSKTVDAYVYLFQA